MICPSCGSRATGRVGAGQFYCWDCCIEWNLDRAGHVTQYEVDPEGELQSLDGEGGEDGA